MTDPHFLQFCVVGFSGWPTIFFISLRGFHMFYRHLTVSLERVVDLLLFFPFFVFRSFPELHA